MKTNKLKTAFKSLFLQKKTYYAVLLFDGQQDYIAGTPYSSPKEARRFCNKVEKTNATLKVTGIIKFKTSKSLIKIENRFDKIREELND